MLTYWNYWY